jgi:putative membrane protein
VTAAPVAFLLGCHMIRAAPLEPLSSFMATHILLMNAVAPLLAMATIVLFGMATARLASSASLVAATLAQLLALAAAHVPSIYALVGRSDLPSAAHVCLFAVSVWFWLAVLGTRGVGRWRSLIALLVTGKLVCLMAAILVLAPRVLFSGPSHAAHGTSLADQHLAGLLMLAACPLTYVVAGVVIAAQWLDDLMDGDTRAGPLQAVKPERAA